MTLLPSSHQASRSTNDASGPPPAAAAAAASSQSLSSKPYHATGDWGKRGMTLQELTRAFDAFNEDEERVAIGFASSEDLNRTLAEPLREVKTVFLDLDGLAPLSLPGYSSCPASSSSCRHVVSHIPAINARENHETSYLMQPHPHPLPNAHTPTPTREYPDPSTNNTRVTDEDSDTIRPSCPKRRRSLLTLSSPPTTPCLSPLPTTTTTTILSLEPLEDEPGAPDIPTRPPSRLAFQDEGNVDGHSTADEATLTRLLTLS